MTTLLVSANIMAAAKAMAMSPVKPKRTVVFILIGGEELWSLRS
jgi:Zn-dependent M28 family amino/carboxypeptidase